ncbi:hypothetical protein B1R94_27675 [Mycolicibacterium litorale]|nr:hypothetical protein B1R94_27675 [Mycolicibacterium litorale]
MVRAVRALAVVGGIGLPVAAYGFHLLGDAYSSPVQLAVPSSQVPLTLTAAGLTWIGLLVTAFGITADDTAPRTTRAVAVATALATVVTVIAVLATAQTVESQARAIDSTTAAAVPVLPQSVALDRQTFHVATGPQRLDQEQPAQAVIAAGAGFLVIDEQRDTITAFDAAGTERWHYRRTGDLAIGRVSAYDNGSTLLVSLSANSRRYPDPDYAAIVALDALTGAVLWTSADQTLVAAATRNKESPFLVYRRGPRWTAFDARTGSRRWAVDNPTPCGADNPQFADTTDRIVALSSCRGSGRDWRLVVLDPATGAVTGTLTLPAPQEELASPSLRFTAAGSTGVLLSFSAVRVADNRNISIDHYIDADTLRVVGLPHGRMAQVDTPGGDPLLVGLDGTTILNTDGSARCAFAKGEGPMDHSGIFGLEPGTVAWTPDSVLYLTAADGHPVLHTARRSDCAQTGGISLAGMTRVYRVLAVPGTAAVFAAESDHDPSDSTTLSNYVVGLGE